MKNWITVILAVLCVLLLGTVGFLNRMNRSEAEKQESLIQEMEELQAQVEELQEQLDASLQQTAMAESLAAARLQEKDALKTALDAAEESADALRTEALLDVELLTAGTVLEPQRIDMTQLPHYFVSAEIIEGDAVYKRIIGKSYVENSNVGLKDLRYLKLLHYNFDHEIQVGELIVAADLAQDYLDIFEELFRQEYEIYSMFLIEEFWTGDGNESDTASCDANNTSAFCYRAITGGSELSNHAFGRAIDINPQQNPYVTYRGGRPYWYHENANDYIDRDSGMPHMIDHEDLCFRLFVEYGFSWGGDWDNVKDYQHFENES